MKTFLLLIVCLLCTTLTVGAASDSRGESETNTLFTLVRGSGRSLPGGKKDDENCAVDESVPASCCVDACDLECSSTCIIKKDKKDKTCTCEGPSIGDSIFGGSSSGANTRQLVFIGIGAAVFFIIVLYCCCRRKN